MYFHNLWKMSNNEIVFIIIILKRLYVYDETKTNLFILYTHAHIRYKRSKNKTHVVFHQMTKYDR